MPTLFNVTCAALCAESKYGIEIRYDSVRAQVRKGESLGFLRLNEVVPNRN